MKRKSPSKTAEDMAGFRAMEMLRPKDDRVCEDPFAKHFLTGGWVNRVKSPFRTKLYQWITHLINPGAHNTVPARVRFIDEHIKTCHKNGLEQLIILGAGYDSRAYRLEELKNGVKDLFSLIYQISCQGSSVVFDFLPPGIVDGSINNRGGKNMYKWARKKGEPFKFAIDKNQLLNFLSPIGFNNINIITAQQCRDIYFKGSNSKRPVSPLFSFACAAVNHE